MEILKPYRAEIDALDDQIVDLLVERLAIIDEVGHLKVKENIPAVLQDRVDEVRERCATRAAKTSKDADIVRQVYAHLIELCCEKENGIIGTKNQ